MADIYGISVQRPALLSEATSMGAAIAGGVGVGIFKDFSVAEILTPVVDTTQPNSALKPLYDKMYEFFVKAYPAFEPLYQDIKRMNS
jgi:xylulokinase